ncbi:hypothetical protein ACP275_05G079300 [Erythranthe tilingii]
MEQREGGENQPPPQSEASSTAARNLARPMDFTGSSGGDGGAAAVSNVEQPLPPAAPLLHPSLPSLVNEGKYAIPKKLRECKCKESRCLKLYCKCLASGTFCKDSCNCVNCHNNEENKAARDEAVNAIFERNPELCGRLPLSQF